MDIRSYFIELYFNQLRRTPLFQKMGETVENSPWHREKNVLVHTDMVVGQYLSQQPDIWTPHTLVGALACAFHDVGKPSSKEEKFSEARGTYFSFKGHEQKSTRLWEDFAVSNWNLFADRLSFEDIYKIGWVIEHHLPWEIVKADKRNMLAQTTNHIFSVREDIFENVLMADQCGRIADDAETKYLRAEQWIQDFGALRLEVSNRLPFQQNDMISAPKLIVPIGSSGVGKSTYKKNNYPDVQSFSLDDCRLRWYSEDYSEAYRMSVEDNTFSNKANQEFFALLKKGKDLYVDNTNLSRKRRQMYITEARKKGYNIVGVLFLSSLNTVTSRQKSRTDKSVPENAVIQHYNSLQYPSYGEMDTIIVVDPEVTT